MTPTGPQNTLRHMSLTLIAVGSASVSLVALLLHALGWLPLYFLVDLLAAPSLVLLLLLGVWPTVLMNGFFSVACLPGLGPASWRRSHTT